MTNPNKPRRMARQPAVIIGDPAPAASSSTADEKRFTKQDLVLDLLRADSGVTLAMIVEATGWLSHTARAALTGLRKKGHAIEKAKVDGATRYWIAALVAA